MACDGRKDDAGGRVQAMNFDYPVSKVIDVRSEDDLCEVFSQHKSIRLVGRGSSQAALKAPDKDVNAVSTAKMDQILRLEADDLTCSVEPGVRREDLDAALAEHGLWLPCGGSGTIGGIFAGDREGPLAPMQPEPRSLLLGLSAVLTDGTRFKSGARVVKNVAGFDLQKLFVGSRGRLFAVTALHLKLRPKPPASVCFEQAQLALPAAMELLLAMRRTQTPPQALSLVRAGSTYTLTGTIDGDPRYLETWIKKFALSACEPTPPADASPHLPVAGLETVQGSVMLKAIPALIDLLPEQAAFGLRGTRFWTHLPVPAADTLLADLPSIGGSGEIVAGEPQRRGLTSVADPMVTRLETEIANSLDPSGVLQ